MQESKGGGGGGGVNRVAQIYETQHKRSNIWRTNQKIG